MNRIQTLRSDVPEARRQVPGLLASANPQDQVCGLVLMAGLGLGDAARPDQARHAPELWLAAVDLCNALFDEPAARSLLEQWQAFMGGTQAAGEAAHNLLLEARLPYGGGTTALQLMIGINDPQAIAIGLYEFAVNDQLPPSVRTEALILLREHAPPSADVDVIQTCAEQVQQTGDAWSQRAQALRAWLEPDFVLDRRFVENTFAKPYPGLVTDLESYCRNASRTGRLTMAEDTLNAFRNSLDSTEKSSLSGSDMVALASLQRCLDALADRR